MESLWLHLSDPAWWGRMITAVLSISLIDLVLSGDNAAVIGLAIRDLPREVQRKAAICGAAGAIILRVIFTVFATFLLTVPYLSVFGGLILIWITHKLLKHDREDGKVECSQKFWSAIWAIMIADLSMAFDNVMGVAGAAHGNIPLVIFGLLLSVPILVWGSTWLAAMMTKYPLIIYIGAAVLIHTSLSMILHDQALHLTSYTGQWGGKVLAWCGALTVLVYGIIMTRKTAGSPAE